MCSLVLLGIHFYDWCQVKEVARMVLSTIRWIQLLLEHGMTKYANLGGPLCESISLRIALFLLFYTTCTFVASNSCCAIS